MLKKTLPTLLLATAALLAALWASDRPMARFSTLDVPEDPAIPEVYLQMKTASSTKCLVGGRGRTTSKRSEEDLGKASWRCRLEGPAPSTFVAQSKLEPSFLFVPVTAVTDPGFPTVYQSLRSQLPWPAPDMRWVHLYHNRQFQGLYLEVQLAARAFAAEQDMGRLELLAARGDELICFDRKMRPVCPIYNLAVADGVFPKPLPSSALQQLFSLTAAAAEAQDMTPERAFVISDGDVQDTAQIEAGERWDYTSLLPFPLPFSLHDALPSAAEPYRDGRYSRWFQDQPVDDEAPPPQALDDDTQAALTALPSSFAASCQVMECNADVLLQRLRGGPSLAWLQEGTQPRRRH